MSERGLAPQVVDAAEAADRAAILHLVAAYGHAIDRRDYALLATLYHADAIDDHSPYFRGSAVEYAAWLPQMLGTWRMTAHRVVSSLLLVSGDVAEGEHAATAYHETAAGDRAFVAHGRYVDRYARRAGVWRFAHRAFVLDWSEERALGAGDDFGSAGVAVGAAGGDDPAYRFLPMFAADRARRSGQPAV